MKKDAGGRFCFILVGYCQVGEIFMYCETEGEWRL